MTQEEEILLRELAGGQCTIQKVTAAIGPMSLWSKAGLEEEIRKAVEAERAPQRTWVGLTRTELIKCGVLPFGMSYELCQAIEDKLKEKNT